MSYRDVNVAANKMARLLQGLGVSRGNRVAVWQDRGFELVISMLACLKAQATFVLCDPSYPAERLGIYVEDSAATMIVTQGRNLEPARAAAARLPARPHVFDLGQLPHASKSESGANLGLLSDPEDLAYVFCFSFCRHCHSECGRGYSCLLPPL
jgi:non-ribosomal peptide synthetase component F